MKKSLLLFVFALLAACGGHDGPVPLEGVGKRVAAPAGVSREQPQLSWWEGGGTTFWGDISWGMNLWENDLGGIELYSIDNNFGGYQGQFYGGIDTDSSGDGYFPVDSAAKAPQLGVDVQVTPANNVVVTYTNPNGSITKVETIPRSNLYDSFGNMRVRFKRKFIEY